MINRRTYSAKPTDVERKWYIVDASQLPLGRLASQVATRLMGKHKPGFTHHIDCGDFVIVTNAAQLQVTGNKLTAKRYYRHSSYPGSLKSATLEQMLAKDPTKVVSLAVKGMLPTNKLRDKRLLRLKVYSGNEHPHEAQQPTKLEIGSK